MAEFDHLERLLNGVLTQYKASFSGKVYEDENNVPDLLMNIFGITPETKRENRQYWGHELGMCWQRLVFEIFRQTRVDFAPPLRIGADEPCDLIAGSLAIDTKYRIGSGDSGTLKKFKAYAPLLRRQGYEPILLIMSKHISRRKRWSIELVVEKCFLSYFVQSLMNDVDIFGHDFYTDVTSP